MNNKNDGGPAFPRSETGSAETGQIDPGAEGMSLRDWFAGMAMQRLLAEGGRFTEPEIGADFAYQQADAMLDERENNDGE